MISPYVTLPGLCEKLERLGVEPHFIHQHRTSDGATIVDLDHPYMVWDLLYPENALKIWNLHSQRFTEESMTILETWQLGSDWQSLIERAVDGRLGEIEPKH